jgi:TonB-dependent starch-binding outer membrane protein SusC
MNKTKPINQRCRIQGTKSFRQLLLLGLFALVPLFSFSQTITVSGTVTEGISNETLPGVNVFVKGTTLGTSTNINGRFELQGVPADAVLVFSSIGYLDEEVEINGQTTVNMIMYQSVSELDEFVVIGYGSVRKRDITGSVVSVDGDDLRAAPVSSVAEAISGKLAGVQITATEGSPDAEIKIRVRGGGSITQDNSPLYIVDGFPVRSINDISPSDIETIDVLKDASSTAIYGSRGANGVIIITTKQAEEGKVSVSYNSFYSMKQIANTLDVLDPQDYVKWQYEYAVLRRGLDNMRSYTQFFGDFQDLDLFANQPMNNWQKQVYGQTGSVFNHDLSIRGGSDNTRFAFNYAQVNDKAIMIGSDFRRDNLSFKMNRTIGEKIELDFNLRYSNTGINGGGANEQNEVSSADSRLKHSVTFAPMPLAGITTDDTDEDIARTMINPITSTYDNNREQKRRNFNIGGSATWKPFNFLDLRSEAGIDNYNLTDSRFYGLTTYYVNNVPSALNQGQPAVILENRTDDRLRNTNTANIDFQSLVPDGHSLRLLLGQELLVSQSQSLTSVVHGFPALFSSDEAFKLTNQGVAHSTENFFAPDDNLLSFFTRANYDYRSKYILAATFRADGSSKFSEQNRWGYFPSAAIAWRISAEEFMSATSNWLEDLKFRVSYGSAGNNRIPSGQISQTFVSNSTAWMNGFESFWSPSKTMANPDLRWETTYTRNLGIDYSLFRGRFSGSIEAYLNTTEDLLIAFPVSGTGYDTQFRNMGETENRGLEFMLNAIAIDRPNYGLNFNFNIGFNQNTIKSLGIMEDFGAATGWASTAIGDDFWISQGGSVGEMYGYKNDGRYEISDFEGYDATSGTWVLKPGVADATAIVGTLRPGKMKIQDMTGDTIISVADRTIIGNANPLHTGGFSLNANAYGFDVSAIFTWSYGNDIYNANKIEYTTANLNNQYRNLITMMEDGQRWTNIDPATGLEVNDPAALSALNEGASMWSPYMDRYVFTDWAVEDGSFLRLNTLSLGYTIPRSLTQRFNISNLRFYVTGYNVAIWTNYSGFDPEVSTRRRTALTPGVDYSAYPRSRQLVFGLNFNF